MSSEKLKKEIAVPAVGVGQQGVVFRGSLFLRCHDLNQERPKIMFSSNRTILLFVIVAIAFLSRPGSSVAAARQAKKPFTVADEIGLTLFGTPNGELPEVHFSSDGNYFAVWSERGRLDLNRVEDSLRIYRSRDVENFLEHSDELRPPSPIWIVDRFDLEGRSIDAWRWLADSSGLAFLESTGAGNRRLVVADLRKRTVEPLTTSGALGGFEIRDRQHYVYTAADPINEKENQAEPQMTVTMGTGRPMIEKLIFPDERRWKWSSQKHLWAVLGGKAHEVKHNGVPIVPDELALSADGRTLVTKLLVPTIPALWETLYPPPHASSLYRIRTGETVRQFVKINLQTGSVDNLTDAPVASDGGWSMFGDASWSNDGESVLLPGTFIKSNVPSRPCVAVVNIRSHNATCVEAAKRRGQKREDDEEGYHGVERAGFVHGDRQRVRVIFQRRLSSEFEENEYHQTVEGTWQLLREGEKLKSQSEAEETGLKISVEQGFDEPPLLVASKALLSRVIWDANPQLRNIDLGLASIYKWKDKQGREWEGGLYKPSNYKPGQRYPLVIQTHGFAPSQFVPSGVFPTANAARALAAAGIVVLQVGYVGECGTATPDEGLCNASGYETVANQLVSEGLVDPDKIGIIGFSRSCYHVMEALTFGSLHLKAASITDGELGDYLQYMLFGDLFVAREYDSMIGAQPFGEGLRQWLKQSPGFNLDRVTAPLLVVGEGPLSLLSMWQPYAGLRFLRKPVDLIMLNTDEHILTNPDARRASQGGSVDWFRFWLKDEEDPDPAKVEQYARWRELRKLQAQNDHKLGVHPSTLD
jgi:dipeptidyl aminopeptidase/acylaminoacyl peptidase